MVSGEVKKVMVPHGACACIGINKVSVLVLCLILLVSRSNVFVFQMLSPVFFASPSPVIIIKVRYRLLLM